MNRIINYDLVAVVGGVKMKMNLTTNRSITNLILWILINVRVIQLSAECNVCAATTQIACVSETQYQFCINNIPSAPVNSCPTNYVCSTTTATVCRPVGTVIATCNIGCNTCDTSLTFACTGTNTYALCLGQALPSTVVNTCGANLVCNVNNPQICGNPALGIIPTCSSSVVPTIAPTITIPTNTPPTYAQFYCQIARINARFPVPTELDNTCRRYIYCFRTFNSTWSGQVYTCAGRTYFDPNSLYCVATRPANC